ncbi:hypothetical protein vseg_013910 [Gypsophila vaccaria]
MEPNFVEFKINHEESSISDCESGTSSSGEFTAARSNRRRVFGVELPETERLRELIRRRFVAGVGDAAEVVAVHRRNWSESLLGQARVMSFRVHADALARKYNCGGDGGGGGGGANNVKFCWYGGDKRRIQDILNRGFDFRDLQTNYGGAVVLSPDNTPSLSVEDSSQDEDGLRHVLLCRVLLGRSELVTPGSTQFGPSSDEFESGVDSYDNPTKYIIWSTHMNTHILPEFVVTFKTIKSKSPRLPSSQGVVKIPTSPWISFPALISVLARILPHDALALINKFHIDYKEKRIVRAEMIQKVRQVVGDKLLIAVVKAYKGRKENKMQHGSMYRRNHAT